MYNLVFTDIQGTRLIPTVPLKSPISGAALVPLRCTHRNRPSHCCPTLPSCLSYPPLYTSHTCRSPYVLYYAAKHFFSACHTLLYTPHTPSHDLCIPIYLCSTHQGFLTWGSWTTKGSTDGFQICEDQIKMTLKFNYTFMCVMYNK